jgi:hypothetical protein
MLLNTTMKSHFYGNIREALRHIAEPDGKVSLMPYAPVGATGTNYVTLLPP